MRLGDDVRSGGSANRINNRGGTLPGFMELIDKYLLNPMDVHVKCSYPVVIIII